MLDVTQLLPGPFATQRLADMGAEVIKVEPPQGDSARRLGRLAKGTGIVFLANNDGKQLLNVDLKTEAGLRQVMEIAATADVVLEGFRPGTADRLGIGYDQLQKINPSVVYCSLTGYGQPPSRLASLAGHDLNYAARSGLLSQLKDKGGQPIVPNVQFADVISGLIAVERIVSALVHKERTGQGAYLDVSMTAALQELLNIHAMTVNEFGVEDGIPEITGQFVCYHLYSTKDGKTVSLAALEDKFWKNFCQAVDRPDWMDHQFAPAEEQHPIYEQIRALFLQRTMKEWTVLGETEDCCLQPVLSIREAFFGEEYSLR